MTLCLTPAMRKKVNKEAFAHHSIGKTITKVLSGKETPYYVGMPLIARENIKKKGGQIVNSEKFTLMKIDEKGALLRNDSRQDDGKEVLVTVPTARLNDTFRYGWCETIARWQGGELDFLYNIVQVALMTYNDLYTALSRTRKWEYVCFNSDESRGKVFEHVKYPFKCRQLEYTQRIEEGFIYEKRFTADNELGKAGQLFYIGRTIDEKKREEQHKRKATNDDMKLALAQPHETKTVVTCRATSRQLDDLESRMIVQAIERGETLLNKKKTKVALAAVEKKKVATVVATIVQTRFNIHTDVKNRRHRIRWVDHKGKRHDEAFRWSHLCTQEEALVRAQAFQKELSDLEIGVGHRPELTLA